MTVPKSIYQLVEKFERNKDQYKHQDYNESNVRAEFVDPLFEALGWNMRDSSQVKREGRVQILGRVKHPDYSFMVGRGAAFYVETKKPSINLQDSAESAVQLRAYGWSGNTEVGILTDFEEFVVYDCRIEPKAGDSAKAARVWLTTYKHYIEQWEELAKYFSRDAVQAGEHRAILESKPRGIFGVDAAFLRDMERWREALAKDIAQRNPNLNQRELNLLVQRTIDRIVFLRIAEDRRIEPYGRLERTASEGRRVYEQLKILFREADDKYNSGLFHFNPDAARASEADDLSMKIAVGSDPLRSIIRELYPWNSLYQFSVIPADILGQVYERFLGKVIELNEDGQAQVTDKPEVRKAGGVYYTPTYIVDYIVENTVGKLLKGKTPSQVAKLRILDPACGSGSFLTGAYQYLLDWHLDYYRQHPQRFRNRRRETTEGFVLTTAEKRRILLNNIYGVDLDQNAVEVSKLALLLKMLENESGATGRQTIMFSAGGQILPDLSSNIKWGNSLIGMDFYSGKQVGMFDEEAIYRIKAFDWESKRDGFGEIMDGGGFDVVIGNPPYVNVRILSQIQGEDVKAYFKDNYRTAFKGYDLYVLFLERSYFNLKSSGIFGMIIPNKIGTLDYSLKARELLLNKTQLKQIVDVSHLSVFGDVSVYPYIIIFSRTEPTQNEIQILIAETKSDVTEQRQYTTIPQANLNPIDGLMIHGTIDVESRVPTQKFADRAKLHSGTTGFSAQEIGMKLREKRNFDGVGFDFIVSGNIDRYAVDLGNVRYMKQDYEMPVLPIKRSGLTANKLNLYRSPKIIIAGMTKWLEATYDEGNIALGVSVYAANKMQDHPYYLLGLLNSKLMSYLFRIRYQAKHLAGGYLAINKGQLSKLPIRTIDFDKRRDVGMHDNMVTLVETMLDLHKQLPGLSGIRLDIVEQRIESTDRQIDRLVYRLYGLTADEIAIVENK